MTLARRMMTAGGGIALPDEDTPSGTPMFGGFFAGIIDTGQSNSIRSEDIYQMTLRYAIIVSPKSLQEDGHLADVDWPGDEGKTMWNGLAVQEALVAPNGDSDFVGWDYAHNISFDGGAAWTGNGYSLQEPGDLSRWYIPAIEELIELYWRLKPTTDNNDVDTYTNTLVFPDGSIDHGRSRSSSPQRSPFTSSNPGQTDVVDFQDGGDESMQRPGESFHRFCTATRRADDRAYCVDFDDGGISDVGLDGKIFGSYTARGIRPVRRVML